MLRVKTIDIYMEHCALVWINYFHGRTNKSKLGVMALHQSRYMWGLNLSSIFYCPNERVSLCPWMAKW